MKTKICDVVLSGASIQRNARSLRFLSDQGFQPTFHHSFIHFFIATNVKRIRRYIWL